MMVSFEDLRFEMSTVTSVGRYEVFIKVQDKDGGDYLAEPFELATDDMEVAERVRNLIITNRNDAIERCRVAMGMSAEEFEAEGIWLQLFLVDTESDGADQSIDDYYESYEVL